MKTVKRIETLSPATKEYIYQQLEELSHYQLPDSMSGVEIQKVTENKKSYFRVRILLTGEGTMISSVGKSKNLLIATKKAKSKLLIHLQNIETMLIDSGQVEASDDYSAQFVTIH